MEDKDFICKLYGLKNLFKTIKTEVKAANNVRLKKNQTNSENARLAGNLLYTQKNREKDTLLQYTKSIAFAPGDSEELALGFSNRSALLLHLHRYEECLTDINRALEITKSDQLKVKLELRKEKCVEESAKRPKEGKIDKQLELPGMITSAKIACAADSVSVEKNAMYIRQLTANRDIKAGEVVITEKAYACCPSDNKIYLICSHCLSFAWNGIPCDFCSYCIYCSEACKKEAWKEYHDVECSILHSIFSLIFLVKNNESSSNQNCGTRDLCLLARTFIKAVKAEGFQNIINETERIDNGTLDSFSDGAFDGNKFRYIYSLRCHPQNSNSSFDKCKSVASILHLLIKRTNLLPVAKKKKELSLTDERMILRLRDIFIKLKSIIGFNAYTHQWYKCPHGNALDCNDSCDSVKGVFVAPFSAIINHSCVSNLGKFSLSQPHIVVYASMPIKKGEQLFLSYGVSFTTGDAAERNRYLEQNMYYTCRCPACTDNESFIKSIKKETGYLKFKKVRIEFDKIFRTDAMHFFFSEKNIDKWAEPTEASLKQALKLIELYHKYFKFNEACCITVLIESYTMRAFHELYGEKCAILSHY